MISVTTKRYYISLQDGLISQNSDASPWQFAIMADEDDVLALREYFDQLYLSNRNSFLRAHVPFVEYHYDSQNDQADRIRKELYELIYKLGDDPTRSFISENGLI